MTGVVSRVSSSVDVKAVVATLAGANLPASGTLVIDMQVSLPS